MSSAILKACDFCGLGRSENIKDREPSAALAIPACLTGNVNRLSDHLSALRLGTPGEFGVGLLASGVEEEAAGFCRIASTELTASTTPKPSG